MNRDRFHTALAAIALVAGALQANGCSSCSEPKKAAAPTAAQDKATPAPEAADRAAAAPAPKIDPSVGAKAAAATKADGDKPVYRGPSSTNPTGYTITTGFSNQEGESVGQPSALETTTSYVTVLAPGNAPIGAFDTFSGAEMHAFLLARDLRHAHYTKTSGAVAEGADARKVSFAPREGGDHALIVVFKPIGKATQAVATPVVFKGALPKIAGPGVAGLGPRSRVSGGDVRLIRTPKQAVVGQPLTLSAERLDNTGAVKATERLKFLAIFNDEMGGGEVVIFSAAGTATWTPSAAGTWLAVAPPREGSTPLTFKIVVAEAEAADPIKAGVKTGEKATTGK